MTIFLYQPTNATYSPPRDNHWKKLTYYNLLVLCSKHLLKYIGKYTALFLRKLDHIKHVVLKLAFKKLNMS